MSFTAEEPDRVLQTMKKHRRTCASVERSIAIKAEYWDHFVGADNSMSMHPSHNRPNSSVLGTWADPEFQGSKHGLTGGLQYDVLITAFSEILDDGDLTQLHLLGDAYSHSYLGEDGVRRMFGGDNFINIGFGDLTLQHKFFDENGNFRGFSGDPTDVIHERGDVYMDYVKALSNIFGSSEFPTFSMNKDGLVDFSIFEYVQENGVTKENNIFLFDSYVNYKDGQKSYSGSSAKQFELLKGYFDQQGVKYSESHSHKRNRGRTYQWNIQIEN